MKTSWPGLPIGRRPNGPRRYARRRAHQAGYHADPLREQVGVPSTVARLALSLRAYVEAGYLDVVAQVVNPSARARRTCPCADGLRPGDQQQPVRRAEVDYFQRGYQFLSDARLDGVGDTLEAIRDGLWDIGLPPRSIEDEWGPGQIEFTYGPMEGLAAADAMVLFRSAVKAICQRRGLLASFMCWPGCPRTSSLAAGTCTSRSSTQRRDAFVSDTDLLAALGRQFVAGLLSTAPAMAVFGDPTVNAARFRPYSFAPDRVAWAARRDRVADVRVRGSRQHRRPRRESPWADHREPVLLHRDLAAGPQRNSAAAPSRRR